MQTERKAGEGLIQGRSVGLSFGCRNTQSQCRNTNAHTLPSTHISATPQTHTHCRNHKRTTHINIAATLQTQTHAHTHVAATTHTHTRTHIAAATPHRYTHVTYNITRAHTNPCVQTHTCARAHTHTHTHTRKSTHSLSADTGPAPEDCVLKIFEFLPRSFSQWSTLACTQREWRDASRSSVKWLGLLKGRCQTINNEQVQVLSGLRGLKFLDLGGCKRLADQGVQSLASLTALTTLNLAECSRITDQGVESLASLTGVSVWWW